MKKEFILLLLNLIVSISLMAGYHFFTYKKIAFVKVPELLSKFNGMVEANKVFEGELSLAKENLDSLRNRYDLINKNMQMSKNERAYKLGKAESELLMYQRSMDQQLQKRKDDLSNEVISKINAYIQEYGLANNYYIILGGTADGNLLFAEDKIDLTKTILDGLNRDFIKVGIGDKDSTTQK